MTKIDLSRIEETVNPVFFPLFADTHRINVLKGGAASGKSYDTAIKIIYKMLSEPGHRYLIVRKVAKTIRHSVYDLFAEILDNWHMADLFKFHETDMTISCRPSGNQILCAGLNDVEKLKSIYGITDIWVEEASEIAELDFNQLNLRLRGETKYKKQITLTFNPVSALHWCKARFFDRVEPDCITHHSTYKDNLRLDADTIKHLESITDPYFKAVYVDGDWGVLGNTVFTNFIIEEFDAKELENVCNGMDFGFAHASTIQRLGFYDGEIYSFDEIHNRGWTNPDFMAAAWAAWGDDAKGWDITADSARPDDIKDWNDNGYHVTGAKKGKGSLLFGIDYLSSKRWHIHETKCPMLAQEVPVFKRREDKGGNALDEFVEINDDGIAACRYATEYIWGQSHGRVAEWSAEDLGL